MKKRHMPVTTIACLLIKSLYVRTILQIARNIPGEGKNEFTRAKLVRSREKREKAREFSKVSPV